MECCKRPNRSDVHLSRDEEAKAEEQTREYFDEMAPKRHSKPQRSEYSSNYVDALSRDDHDNPHPIPELVEFKRLEHNTQVRLSIHPIYIWHAIISEKTQGTNLYDYCKPP